MIQFNRVGALYLGSTKVDDHEYSVRPDRTALCYPLVM